MRLIPEKTALLTLDFQKGILDLCPEADAILPTAARVAETARERGLRILHVGLGFSPGHPEIPNADLPFRRIKDNGLFLQGSPSAEFIEPIVRPDELVIYKQRVGAFSENHLHLTLRALGIENLVLCGITTSGIVLSTLRRAFDLDFRSTVIADACFDRDEEVHRVLTEKVFPSQATVVSSEAFIAERG